MEFIRNRIHESGPEGFGLRGRNDNGGEENSPDLGLPSSSSSSSSSLAMLTTLRTRTRKSVQVVTGERDIQRNNDDEVFYMPLRKSKSLPTPSSSNSNSIFSEFASDKNNNNNNNNDNSNNNNNNNDNSNNNNSNNNNDNNDNNILALRNIKEVDTPKRDGIGIFGNSSSRSRSMALLFKKVRNRLICC